MKQQWKRHSMPSLYMIMDILLRRHGHVPYYQIPSLKDKQLEEQVIRMVNALDQKQL